MKFAKSSILMIGFIRKNRTALMEPYCDKLGPKREKGEKS
jgi:hypothetical protein